MPADETYDAVHPATIAGDRYGCHGRPPFADAYRVRDGYTEEMDDARGWTDARVKFVWIDDKSSRGCMHDQKTSDPRCAGCRWIDETGE